jgi:hypothetical protein
MVFIRLPHSGLVLIAEKVSGGFLCHEHESEFFATDEVEEVGSV